MKVGLLLKILQGLDPETNVRFTIGNDSTEGEEYRLKCAKAQIQSGACLDWLDVNWVQIEKPYEDEDELLARVILRQDDYSIDGLDNAAERFDKRYIENPGAATIDATFVKTADGYSSFRYATPRKVTDYLITSPIDARPGDKFQIVVTKAPNE